uniref:Sushi domain-containing protein n=1 Tax=Macrostomum lignano TaxID=282301 RepID=A0A1I8F836_9PLAT
ERGTFLHVDCYRIDDWIWLDGTPAIDASLPRDQSGRLPAVPDGTIEPLTLYALARLGLVDNQSSIVYQWHLTTNESTPHLSDLHLAVCTCAGWDINAWEFSCDEHCPTTHTGLGSNSCHSGKYYSSENSTEKKYQPVLMAGNETRDIVLDCLTNRTLVGIPSGFNPQNCVREKALHQLQPDGARKVPNFLNSVVQLGQSIDYKCVHDKYQNHTGTMRCKCDGFHNVTDINFVCEP